MGCSHLNHVLTASSASDSACSEQLPENYVFRHETAREKIYNLEKSTRINVIR